MNNHLVAIFTLIIVVWEVRCQTLSQAKTLMTDKLNGYERRLRQTTDQSVVVQVNVSFDLVAIQDFDEIQEKFSLTGVLYMTWFDESLVWDPTAYGNIYSMLFNLKDIWYPVLVLGNAFDDIEDTGESWMTARVLYNGFAMFTPGSVFESTCSVDVTYYPFDEQTCHLLFIPWGYTASELSLYTPEETVLQTYYQENGEWSITSTRAEHDHSGDATVIRFFFTLKRKPLFLIINVILPILFMGVINILVFVLPPQCGERVSFSITVLLAIAVFLTLVGDNLPKTSEPMSILSYYLMISLIISLLICVVTILNLRLYFKEADIPIPKWCRTWVLFTKFRCRRSKKVINQVNPVPNAEEKPYSLEINKIEDDDDTTWEDVSYAVDKISFVTFLVMICVSTTAFIAILVQGA